MPTKLSNAQHDAIYQTIAKAEGEECIVCHMDHFIPRKTERRNYKSPRGFKLEIDHADGDRTNWAWSNLHLVCKKHNCALRGMTMSKHITLLRGYSIRLERERDRENLPTYKSVLKEGLSYDNASLELKLNKTYEAAWGRYAHKSLRDSGTVLKKNMISGGAMAANCSIQTSTNYLTKYTAPNGPFEEKQDEDGNRIIAYRAVPTLYVSPSTPAGIRGDYRRTA